MTRPLLTRLTLRSALMLFLSLGVLLPVLVFSLVFTVNQNRSFQQMQLDSATTTATNNARQLEHIVESISYTAAYLSTNADMRRDLNLLLQQPGSAEAAFAKERIIRRTREFSNATLYALSPDITLLLPGGKSFSLDRVLSASPPPQLFTAATFPDNKAVWQNVLQPGINGDLQVSWPMTEKDKILSILIIRIPAHTLWQQLTSHPLLQYRQDIYSHGALVSYHAPADMDESAPVEFSVPLHVWGFTLTVTVPTGVLNAPLRQQQWLFFLYFFILVAVLFAVISILSGLISRPIKSIVAQMQKIQQGDFSPTPVPASLQEVSLLSENLNEVAECIQGLMRTAAEQATLKDDMRFRALMAQINPHFLYNTLGGIKWLATIKGNTLVADMLGKLGNILHYSFAYTSDTIALAQELGFLSDYVDLLQMRYANIFTYTTDIPDALLAYEVPRFCLQPLLENAITHGVLSKTTGCIRLTARRTQAGVFLLVQDNGPGMPQPLADSLLKPQPTPPLNKNSSIGLSNIQQRIRLLYGRPYGLSIRTAPGGGCLVEVHLPSEVQP